MEAIEPFWNKIAERYASKPVPDLEAYQAKLRATKAVLTPHDHVLDIGCGTGSLALELAPCVAQVHSVDVSREMLRIARQKAAAAGVDNITFHHTPISTLPPFGRASFDAVCAFNIFHLLADRPATLSKLHALLKPGGHFISTTPCLGESRAPYKLILPLLKRIGKAPAVEVFRVETFEREMREAGFVDLKRPSVSPDRTVAFIVATKPATERAS